MPQIRAKNKSLSLSLWPDTNITLRIIVVLWYCMYTMDISRIYGVRSNMRSDSGGEHMYPYSVEKKWQRLQRREYGANTSTISNSQCGPAAAMTTAVTTSITSMARVLTTVTHSAESGQPFRSADTLQTGNSRAHIPNKQPSNHARMPTNINGGDLAPVMMDHAFTDSNGFKLQPRNRNRSNNINNNQNRRIRDLAKSKVHEDLIAPHFNDIPAELPVGGWDSSVSADVKGGNNNRTLTFNIDLRKVPKRRFVQDPSPQQSAGVSATFTSEAHQAGSSFPKSSSTQPYAPTNNAAAPPALVSRHAVSSFPKSSSTQQHVPAKNVVAPPAAITQQENVDHAAVSIDPLKAGVKGGHELWASPHQRPTLPKPIVNGKQMEPACIPRITPCIPNVGVPKPAVPKALVPIAAVSLKPNFSSNTAPLKPHATNANVAARVAGAVISPKVNTCVIDVSPPNVSHKDAALKLDNFPAGDSAPTVPHPNISVAAVSPRNSTMNTGSPIRNNLQPNLCRTGVPAPHIFNPDIPVTYVVSKKLELIQTHVSKSNVGAPHVSNDNVSSNASNVNASIANGSNCDMSTVMPDPSPSIKAELLQNGKRKKAFLPVVVASKDTKGSPELRFGPPAPCPIGEWDSSGWDPTGQGLAGWDGKWNPAPVEWGLRPAFDHSSKDHIEFMATWLEQNQVQAETNPIELNTEDPGFRAGTAPAAGGRTLGSPIDTKTHDTILPDDDFTKAKRHETANTASDMLKDRIRAPGSKSKEVYRPEYGSKAERKAQREAHSALLEELEAVPSPHPAVNPHIPKAKIYIRPVESGDLRQVASIYNHYVDHSVVVPEMKRLNERQWAGRLADCRESNYAFLVAVQLVAKDGVNNRRGQQETICGFAYADDYGDKENAWRYTCELQVYVGSWIVRKGVGKSLIDRMMVALDPEYIPRGAVRFNGGADAVRYEGGGVRVIRKVVITLPYAAKDENTLKWQKEWLSQWRFEQMGCLLGIGRKLDKV